MTRWGRPTCCVRGKEKKALVKIEGIANAEQQSGRGRWANQCSAGLASHTASLWNNSTVERG